MALLTILEYPDPRLRTKADPVSAVDDSTRALIDNMLQTMYAAPGIGLAASQVNVHKRVIVIDISEERDAPHVFINPELTLSGEVVETREGCLSIPGIHEPVARREQVQVQALDRNGELFSLQASGLLSVCIQHECDHLEGKLFVDYLSNLKRVRIRRKLKQKQA